MTTLTYTVSDSATMLRRNLKHQLRYPSLSLMLAGSRSCSCCFSSTSSAANSVAASVGEAP